MTKSSRRRHVHFKLVAPGDRLLTPGGGRRVESKILSPKLGSDLLARPIESISYVAGHLIWGMTGAGSS